MNTENLIPISYVKKFTPLVKGDELFYKDGGYKFTLKSKVNAALYNNNDETVDKYYSLVSFAARPNTGKQPVGDDVVVDVSWYSSINAAGLMGWTITHDTETWKPNHAAMLAKFKEQGANTVRQYDDQEAELATHYSGNNNRFYKQCPNMIRQVMVLDDIGRWIYSDCTTNAELNGDEFWKLDGNQVLSEDWVIDHLTDKPVFTQEMYDNKETPQIGSSVLFDSQKVTIVGMRTDGKPIFELPSGYVDSFSSGDSYRPINNRTDKQKLISALSDEFDGWTFEEFSNYNYAKILLESDKFTITLNK